MENIKVTPQSEDEKIRIKQLKKTIKEAKDLDKIIKETKE